MVFHCSLKTIEIIDAWQKTQIVIMSLAFILQYENSKCLYGRIHQYKKRAAVPDAMNDFVSWQRS